MGCQNAGGQGLTRGRISKKRVIKINLSDVPLFVKNLFCCSFRAKLLVCNFRAKFILLVVQFPCKIYFACCAISVQNLFCLLCNFRAKFILLVVQFPCKIYFAKAKIDNELFFGE